MRFIDFEHNTFFKTVLSYGTAEKLKKRNSFSEEKFVIASGYGSLSDLLCIKEQQLFKKIEHRPVEVDFAGKKIVYFVHKLEGNEDLCAGLAMGFRFCGKNIVFDCVPEQFRDLVGIHEHCHSLGFLGLDHKYILSIELFEAEKRGILKEYLGWIIIQGTGFAESEPVNYVARKVLGDSAVDNAIKHKRKGSCSLNKDVWELAWNSPASDDSLATKLQEYGHDVTAKQVAKCRALLSIPEHRRIQSKTYLEPI